MGFKAQNDFQKGVEATKKYIDYCWDEYTYADDEFLARAEFLSDLMEFIHGNKPYIPNRHGKTFEQFCQENSV